MYTLRVSEHEAETRDAAARMQRMWDGMMRMLTRRPSNSEAAAQVAVLLLDLRSVHCSYSVLASRLPTADAVALSLRRRTSTEERYRCFVTGLNGTGTSIQETDWQQQLSGGKDLAVSAS